MNKNCFAFWICLLISNIWQASDQSQLMAIGFLLLAGMYLMSDWEKP